jgi:PTH1 family peptidyl-tRNA hydrolase
VFVQKGVQMSQVTRALVCLGNPGKQYEKTRHNAGFLFSSFLREAFPSRSLYANKFQANVFQTEIASQTLLIIEPQSFMNLSGEPTAAVLRHAKISHESLIVAHDEVDIPLGHARWKIGGGDAGHNGLKSITKHLGTNAYARLRIGVGRPEKLSEEASSEHAQGLSSWVLGRFTGHEQELLAQVFQRCQDSLLLALKDSCDLDKMNFSRAQQELHREL